MFRWWTACHPCAIRVEGFKCPGVQRIEGPEGGALNVAVSVPEAGAVTLYIFTIEVPISTPGHKEGTAMPIAPVVEKGRLAMGRGGAIVPLC